MPTPGPPSPTISWMSSTTKWIFIGLISRRCGRACRNRAPPSARLCLSVSPPGLACMSHPLPPPLKRWGQHFLIDQNIVRKIIDLAAIQPHETVLEIGPGRGILTRALCAKAGHVLAIEIDRQLAQLLSGTAINDSSGADDSGSAAEPPLAMLCPNLDVRVG